jgi:hypothetical protein
VQEQLQQEHLGLLVRPLNAGTAGSPAIATYTGGTGTDALSFQYVVQPGHGSPKLHYSNPAALALNGGTITDLADNNADLTLPSNGILNLASATANLVIDTTPPSLDKPPALSAQDITGRSNAATQHTRDVGFDFHAGGAVSAKVEVRRGGALLTPPIAAEGPSATGDFHAAVPGPLADGVYQVTPPPHRSRTATRSTKSTLPETRATFRPGCRWQSMPCFRWWRR